MSVLVRAECVCVCVCVCDRVCIIEYMIECMRVGVCVRVSCACVCVCIGAGVVIGDLAYMEFDTGNQVFAC